jgi:hypothetical protein
MCAVLLLRGYFTNRSRLLFWSGAAFCAFGVSNLILCVDALLVPNTDLSLLRNVVTLLGLALLLRGLIWETSS